MAEEYTSQPYAIFDATKVLYRINKCFLSAPQEVWESTLRTFKALEHLIFKSFKWGTHVNFLSNSSPKNRVSSLQEILWPYIYRSGSGCMPLILQECMATVLDAENLKPLLAAQSVILLIVNWSFLSATAMCEAANDNERSSTNSANNTSLGVTVATLLIDNANSVTLSTLPCGTPSS